MSNPARQKGTSFEHHVLEAHLCKVWPTVERAPLKGVLDYGDFINIDGWLIEAKKRDRWDLPGWIRGVLSKIGRQGEPDAPWAIVFAGDKRSEINMDLVVLPAALYFVQLQRLYDLLRRRITEP